MILKRTEHIIKEVAPGSIAEAMDIEAGDVLLEINNQPICDVFDYRFLIKDEYIEVLIRKSDGEEWILEIEKDFDDDLGLEFENGLMSEYKSCTNKCMFCFIDQMPPGMRDTLYFKDDDSRLSFLQGNYITLTNMNDRDFERIIHMQLAPINVSVHTTNPELRCRMLNNRFAGEKLKYLDMLYEGHVEMNGQIVLVKGVNDGDELEKTIKDLGRYLPFMRSVSVVPAGITKYREGLYPIELFTSEDAAQVIDLIEMYQKKYYSEYGLNFVHASDEWYINAGRSLPEAERYDGYIQLENGVGMIRLFCDETEEAIQTVIGREDYEKLRENTRRTVTVVTGRLAYPYVEEMARKLMSHFPNIQINVCEIVNRFFGETITVTGLITGQDLVKQLHERKSQGTELGDALLIPSSMLRTGEEVFLDDYTLAEVGERLGIKCVVVDSSGADFVEAALNDKYCMDRENDEGFVYVKSYNR